MSRKRMQVRVERVDTACGSVGHMTVDQIVERLVGGHVNVNCPDCGRIHLFERDIQEAESLKVTDSEGYRKIMEEALYSEEPEYM